MRLPNGYGSIHKLSGNRRKPWRVRITKDFTDEGKQVYETIGYFETRTLAITALNEYHKDPYRFKTGKLTLESIYNLWHKEKINNGTNIKILNKDEWAFKYCDKIKDMEFKEIRKIHLQKIINDIPEDMKATRHRVKTVLNQIYKFAMANDICDKNYINFIDAKDIHKSDKHKPFTTIEKELLWNNLNIPFVDMILVYLYTGFRPSELLEIKCETNVNLEQQYLQGGMKTEAGINRIVPIHTKIKPIIEKYYNLGNEYLFMNGNIPFTYGTYEYRFKQVMQQLGLEHSPHDTRHTTATDLDAVGANKVAIQRILGHASENITDKVYTHKSIEELRKNIELLK